MCGFLKQTLWLLTMTGFLGATGLSAHAAPHTVTKGQTLWGISQHYGCSVELIKKQNRLRNDFLQEGQVLEIPSTCKKAPPAASTKRNKKTHVVLKGDTLELIALRYGMPIKELKELNKKTLQRGLKAGQKLTVLEAANSGQVATIYYTIQKGDTFGSVAARFGMSPQQLMKMNPRKKPKYLKVGDKLTVNQAGRATESVAVGKPSQGKLVKGEHLKSFPGAFVRRPHKSWGTNELVRLIKAGVAEVRRKHPGAHDLVIGDLSKKEGGPISPHLSHQNGTDVDLGFYFVGQKKEGPKVALDARVVKLDHAPTWTFLETIVGPSAKSSAIEVIFLDYDVQGLLYQWAKKNGVSQKKLNWIFQYPRGKNSTRGLIRHWSGHHNHFHVRIKCPEGDACK